MPKFSQLLPKEVLSVLLKAGFIIQRQVGSHVRLTHQNGRKVTVAIHPKPLSKGDFSNILHQAQMSKKEFEQWV